MWSIRQHEPGWSNLENYAKLPAHQKIWLDNANLEQREISNDWVNKIIEEFSRWIVFAYKWLLGKQAILIGDAELSHIRGLIEMDMEALK